MKNKETYINMFNIYTSLNIKIKYVFKCKIYLSYAFYVLVRILIKIYIMVLKYIYNIFNYTFFQNGLLSSKFSWLLNISFPIFLFDPRL